MSTVGILAYGSLVGDPGEEIVPLIVRRIQTMTPFAVEYARISETRGGAPTVVPTDAGTAVDAKVLVLGQATSLEEAKDLLWRRETHQMGTGKRYPAGNNPNSVQVREVPGYCGVDHVLYTDFPEAGKQKGMDARALAEEAIRSVAEAPPGQDGITYLYGLISMGIVTALTADYCAEILSITGSKSLPQALERLRGSAGISKVG